MSALIANSHPRTHDQRLGVRRPAGLHLVTPPAPPSHTGTASLIRPDLDEATLAELNERFERSPASAVVAWAAEQFGEQMVLAASMADCVLLDVISHVHPTINVAFIDTGYHFPETLETLERAQRRYEQASFEVWRNPAELDNLWRTDPDGCCAVRKVALLDAALAGRHAWLSGLRRVEAATRTNAPVLSRDRRGMIKINPIVMWDDLDIAGYIADHDIIVNPLVAQGFASIGCAPCTTQVGDGEDSRAGRWAGLGKVECGLHQ